MIIFAFINLLALMLYLLDRLLTPRIKVKWQVGLVMEVKWGALKDDYEWAK